MSLKSYKVTLKFYIVVDGNDKQDIHSQVIDTLQELAEGTDSLDELDIDLEEEDSEENED